MGDVAKLADTERGSSLQNIAGRSRRAHKLSRQSNNLPDYNRSQYELEVRNLTYKLPVKGPKGQRASSEKVLLNNVSATARAGQILAVMGPSGAGKSTFLDAVGGQIERRSLEGSILVNGKPIEASFKRLSGYVMQDDQLFPMLTVRETLMFSARLRLPSEMTLGEKRARVEMMIQELGLQGCAETCIGDHEVRGVSGGERRRVSIGVDLIHDPPVLFLDEPTSGLDSTSALNVIQTLHRIAEQRKRTILLTIHQPSARILELIHDILILARGNPVYGGPYSAMVAYWKEYGKEVPEHVNVLEYALDLIEEQQDSPEGLAPLISFAASKTAVKKGLASDSSLRESEAPTKSSHANGFMQELLILLDRSFKNIFRSKTLFVARTFLLVFTGLTMGSVFWDLGYSIKGIQQRQSYFAFSIALIIFTSTEGLPIYLDERQIYLRETSRGAYRTATYVLAGAIVFIPFLFFLACVYSSVSYFMVGLHRDANSFLIFVSALFQTFAVANSFVIFLAALVPNFISANTIITSFSAYFFLFSGFYISQTNIPRYWIWMHYISTFKYPLEMLEHNEFSSLSDVCWNRDASGNCTQDSAATLRSLSAGKVHMVQNGLIMAFLFVFYRFLFYLVLKFQTGLVRK